MTSTDPSPMPEPTGTAMQAGTEHRYRADELFFSTTDARGRIRRANSTFMRLSGYERGALVGSPHNVVRHEAMPAGLFRAVWEDIESGRAASAYITNRSADGGFYRVFATIVPSQGGYLSVRSLPMLTDLRDQVEGVYERVRRVEDASRQAGSTAREVAAAGRAALETELKALGFKDPMDFTRQILPAEVAALVGAGVGIPERPGARGPVAVILEEMNRIEDSTADLVALLDECARLVTLLRRRAAEIDALSSRLGRLRTSLRGVVGDVERLADAGGAREAEEVRERYREVDALVLECVEQLNPLSGQVEELRGDADSVRFAIALMRLHNLAAGFFALQVLEGHDDLDANDAVGSLHELVSALREGAVSLSQRLELYRARAELVAGELDVVAEALTLTHQPVLQLLGAASEAGAGDEADTRLARSLVRDGFPEVRDLADLAGAVRDLEVPDASEEIDAGLTRVALALAEIG